MKLNSKQYSAEGQPLLICHGMLGNLNNWAWHSRRFAEDFAVYALDMRNHGASPHSSDMDYALMSNDVLEFMDAQGLDQVNILGHSMGGKVAMQLALKAPQRVRKLVVADIAPVAYEEGRDEHDEIFEGLSHIDLTGLRSRREADEQLVHWVSDEIVRQFLLSNLQRKAGGGFEWRINLPAIKANYPKLKAAVQGDPYPGEVLFVRGDLSEYIQPAHREAVLALFPQAGIKTIMQAGHWLHAEKPQTFQRIVRDFLLGDS